MESHFAPAERTPRGTLQSEIRAVDQNPFMTGLLHSINGLLAILDRNRQIVALNHSFLEILGIADPEEALGLRPGEALQCVHAKKSLGGCGTSEFCSTCGAAVAIVASLGQDTPVERMCALQTKAGEDIYLRVRSQPVEVEGTRFLLLFMQDISVQQKRAALERTFFHDINNMIAGLVGLTRLFDTGGADSDLQSTISGAASRLISEVRVQQQLLREGAFSYQPARQRIEGERIWDELKSFFRNHPAGHTQHLHFEPLPKNTSVVTDLPLLLRVMSNMITNALEASGDGGEVRVWVEHCNNGIALRVHNAGAIPPEIQRRVFQRNFSTKPEEGRGLGTYSMKVFGEEVLGGKVWFASSEANGTVFTLMLPAAEG